MADEAEKRFVVQANPKGGTVKQIVTAKNPTEAIEKAQSNPDGWVTADPKPGSLDHWSFRAYERS